MSKVSGQISAVISVKERKDNWSLRTQYSSPCSHLLREDDPLRVKAVVIRDKSGLFKNDLKRVACFSAREPVVCSHCHRLHEKGSSVFVLHCTPEGSSTAPFMWQFHQSKYCVIHILIKMMPYSSPSSLWLFQQYVRSAWSNQLTQQHPSNNLHGYRCVSAVKHKVFSSSVFPEFSHVWVRTRVCGEGGGGACHSMHFTLVSSEGQIT